MKYILISIGIGCVVLSSLFTSKALAASTVGSVITTSPVSIDLSANPGSTTTTTLSMQNNGLKPVTVSVKLEEFKAVGDGGQAQIFVPPPSDPSLSWVHFSQTSFTAQPGVWVPITMSIKVPKTAAFGYYYAVLFAPNTATSTLAKTNTVKGANAILVLLDAHNPNESNTLQVDSFSSTKKSYQYLPATFSINVHNSGNTFTIPEGDIYISRTLSGHTIDTLDINSAQGNVLPGTNRVFQASWNDGFPVYQLKRINGQIVSGKNGKPVQRLSWDWSQVDKFRYGKYYAHLVLVYSVDGRDVPVNAIVSFWVIPWLLLFVLLVVTVLVCLGLWTIIRSIIRRLRPHKRSR